jgi:hypothetical protein
MSDSEFNKIVENMESDPPVAYVKYNPASNTWDAGWRWADGYFLPEISGYRTRAEAEGAIPRLDERFKEILEASKNLAPPVTPELVAQARASNQTKFRSSKRLPDNEGRVFVTDVPDAPLQVMGRLGLDGRWYISRYTTVSRDDPNWSRINQLPIGIILLRDEPVADAMICHCIDQALAAARAGQAPRDFADFKKRLMASRFWRGS